MKKMAKKKLFVNLIINASIIALIFSAWLYHDYSPSKARYNKSEWVLKNNQYIFPTNYRSSGNILPKGTHLTPLAVAKTGTWAKVKTDDNQIGFMSFKDLGNPYLTHYKVINNLHVLPVSFSEIKNLVGKELKDAENLFGPVHSILGTQYTRNAFFADVEYFDEYYKYRGVYFYLDKDQKILGYTNGGKILKSLADKLPLTNFVRKLRIYKFLGTPYYLNNPFEFTAADSGKGILWGLMMWILKILSFIILCILLFSIPSRIVRPWRRYMLYDPNFNALQIALYAYLPMLLISYIFFVYYTSITEYPIILGIVYFLFNFLLIYIWNDFIKYDRCPNCNYMDVGKRKGSTYLGMESSTSSETKNRYVGTTEEKFYDAYSKEDGMKYDELTVETDHYQQREKVTNTKTYHYKDHIQCAHCGYKWNVKREEVKTKKHYV
jgi:DNA-directed RNA polymerase subunit RPC12/RpoP